jgi:hypothetical protein
MSCAEIGILGGVELEASWPPVAVESFKRRSPPLAIVFASAGFIVESEEEP